MNVASYPKFRLRRNRQAKFIRNLTQENWLAAQDLVYPIFVIDGVACDEPILSLPGQSRLSLDLMLRLLEKVMILGIQAVALFPVIRTAKDNVASESYNANGLIQRAIALIKANFPTLGVFSDIALDPYTIHGQDGIIDDNGYVLNDVTIEVLIKQALSHAAAGADFVCPSDMMDGRVGLIRAALEENGFHNTGILAYAAKYASQFYGPFRDAIGSASNLGRSDKLSYQMHPANGNEALREVELDIAEGADIIMVKPGLPYLDILYRVKHRFNLPTAVYQVSGEYAMLKAAAEKGYLDYNAALLETLLGFKRAGADMIWTYAACDVINFLRTL